MFSGVQKSVREWTFTLLNEFLFWELKSQWTFKFLKVDFRGQNPLDWKVPDIIEKLLNGLVWPIWTSETQVMAKKKVGSQIGSLTPDH